MADKRMYLVNERTGHLVLLAKFWHSQGWLAFDGERDGPDLDGTFEESLRAGYPRTDEEITEWKVTYED